MKEFDGNQTTRGMLLGKKDRSKSTMTKTSDLLIVPIYIRESPDFIGIIRCEVGSGVDVVVETVDGT